MKKTVLSFILIIFFSLSIIAQNLKKANLLFEKRAYLDAAELFIKEDNKTQEIFEKLGDCYYFNTEMEQAVKWYSIVLDNYENTTNAAYIYRYSQALKGIEKFKESDKWLQKYNQKKLQNTDYQPETLSFFESLNKEIKHPYNVYKVTINTENSDFGTSFYGNKIIFASAKHDEKKLYDWNKQPYLDLYEATKDAKGNLSNVQTFSSKINTEIHESNAIFTKDGKTMYFTRNNYISGKKRKDKNNVSHLKIYRAKLINNQWTSITELPFNSDNYSVEHPALSPNEKQLYFSSDMPGSIGSFDIFEVDIHNNGTFGNPKNLGDKINTEHREQFPFVSSKNILYFASDGHFGLGGLDIFKSEINTHNFSKPVNLSDKINSNLDDFAFIINEENNSGYFSSNRNGGIGSDDIYRFTKKSTTTISGIIHDKNNFETLEGTTVTLYDKNNTVISKITTTKDASYIFEIEKNKIYKIQGNKNLYLPSEIVFSTNNEGDLNINLFLESNNEIQKSDVTINNVIESKLPKTIHKPIYFDLNSSYLRAEAKIELNAIVKLMKNNPKLTIKCNSHTDSRESYTYNIWLSDRRANRTVNYIKSKGIADYRISGKGYSETQLVNKCKSGIKCKESEHQQNRRTEFIVIEPN